MMILVILLIDFGGTCTIHSITIVNNPPGHHSVLLRRNRNVTRTRRVIGGSLYPVGNSILHLEIADCTDAASFGRFYMAELCKVRQHTVKAPATTIMVYIIIQRVCRSPIIIHIVITIFIRCRVIHHNSFGLENRN